MDLYAVTYELEAPKRDGGESFIGLMMWMVVAQNLRGLDALHANDYNLKWYIGCQKWQYGF